MSNPYADRARHQRAVHLADVLDHAGADPDAITDESWHLACQVVAAQTGREFSPPSDRTKHLTAEMLRERARLRDTDPFAGVV